MGGILQRYCLAYKGFAANCQQGEMKNQFP
jgi:hypothetical protein